jgi:integrase
MCGRRFAREMTWAATTGNILLYAWELSAGHITTDVRAARVHISLSIHILRHTFCSHLVMRGAPMRAVQELVGRLLEQDPTRPSAPRTG